MVADVLFRVARFWRRYKNPVSVALARLLRRQELVLLWDRKTGIKCRARFGALSIFTEVFHNRDYDVPGVAPATGQLVIDVGAHQGFFACYAARQGAEVHAYEPADDNYSLLVENVARNGLVGRVIPHKVAITGHGGEVALYLTEAMGGAMNTTCASYPAAFGARVLDERNVPSLRLGEVFDALQGRPVRMCKIDIEGAELEILRSLRPDQAALVDCFVLEYHEPLSPLEDLVAAISAWRSHQVSLAEDTETGRRRILRAVATRCLV